MLYKLKHLSPLFSTFDFLKQRFQNSCQPAAFRKSPRGIEQAKKANIISNLVKFMPESRREFWKNLDESKSSKDLAKYYE